MPEKTYTKNLTSTKSNINKDPFNQILGNDPKFRAQINMAKEAAKTDLPVMIVGETGVGKELVAKAIHQSSKRKSHPYIGENCSAIPQTLAEGVLFGTEVGGFTGAISRKGVFEQASGGTLLLDELNSMSVFLQSKLLRVLQESYLRRIGGTKDIFFDVRMISALSESPETLIEQGRLRTDLYYRLNVVELRLPPLRERKADIPIYVEAFIEKANETYEASITGIKPDALAQLMEHDYPGNVRELENLIHSAVALSDGKGLLEEDFF